MTGGYPECKKPSTKTRIHREARSPRSNQPECPRAGCALTVDILNARDLLVPTSNAIFSAGRAEPMPGANSTNEQTLSQHTAQPHSTIILSHAKTNFSGQRIIPSLGNLWDWLGTYGTDWEPIGLRGHPSYRIPTSVGCT